MGSQGAYGAYQAGNLRKENIPEILVVARDRDDFHEHIDGLEEDLLPHFNLILVDHWAMIGERANVCARVHFTPDCKQHPDYHEILSEIASCLDETKVRFVQFRRDLPESWMPEDVEDWLAR